MRTCSCAGLSRLGRMGGLQSVARAQRRIPAGLHRQQWRGLRDLYGGRTSLPGRGSLRVRHAAHDLEQQLSEAVRTEDYVRAAALRDELQALKAEDPLSSLQQQLKVCCTIAFRAAQDMKQPSSLAGSDKAVVDSLCRMQSAMNDSRCGDRAS